LYDDIPPPEEPLDGYPIDAEPYGSASDDHDGWGAPRPTHVAAGDAGVHEVRTLPREVLTTLRRIIAVHHGRDARDLLALLDNISAAKRVMEQLDETRQRAYDGLLEALGHAATNSEGVVDLHDIPAITEFGVYADEVVDELGAVQAHIGSHEAGFDPIRTWFSLVEAVQRAAARDSYRAGIEAIDRKATAKELVVVHKALEYPTAQAATSVGADQPLMAGEWSQAIKRARAGSPLLRISSGYRTLDIASTAPGEALGFLTCGELAIKAAGTGQGKSSDASIAVPAAAQDLVNWGRPDGKVLLVHTEEEIEVKLKQMQLEPGMRNHHLIRNIGIRKVGTRLQNVATAVYDAVVYAMQQARGGDLSPYLPYVLYVDYVQALKVDPAQREADAVAQAANFLLYGVAAWDFEEMALYSGLHFREYTGMAVPEGMEDHRVAVISYAQLIKQSGERQWYRPGHRATPEGDFVIEGPDGNPGWEILPGDLRIPTQDEVRGGGQLLQHAANLIFLHRSRPNASIVRPKDGSAPYLTDTRARFVLSKTRNGTDMPYVPMTFSSNPNEGVNKGQYFDTLAEMAIERGMFVPDTSWRQTGDFIVPVRSVSSPFSGVRYE
jgi:hypothetical protein